MDIFDTGKFELFTMTENEGVSKISLDVRQTRRMVHDRSVWWVFVSRGGMRGRRSGNETLS